MLCKGLLVKFDCWANFKTKVASTKLSLIDAMLVAFWGGVMPKICVRRSFAIFCNNPPFKMTSTCLSFRNYCPYGSSCLKNKGDPKSRSTLTSTFSLTFPKRFFEGEKYVKASWRLCLGISSVEEKLTHQSRVRTKFELIRTLATFQFLSTRFVAIPGSSTMTARDRDHELTAGFHLGFTRIKPSTSPLRHSTKHHRCSQLNNRTPCP